MTKRPAGRLVLAVLAVAALLLSACTTRGDSPAGPGNQNGPAKTHLTVGATASPPTLDPTANDAAAIPQVLLYNVYETLVKVDSEGRLRPLLAQRWDVSADNLTYTFQIDPAARFASGRAVEAKDVVWSIERIQDGTTTATLKRQMSVVESARAVDAKTLEVVLNRPSNMWLWDMSSTGGIVFDSESTDDLANKTTGSGPFQLDTWIPNSSVSLVKNPNYWATAARFENVNFRYFTDPNAMNAAMLAGDLDIISNLQAPAALPQFSDTERFTVIDGTTNGEVVLSMNNSSEGLKDPRVRQAIRHAIDKKALRDTVWAGKGELIGAMVPPTDPWFEDRTGDFPYDPERAKALLAEAGVQNLRLRLRLPTLPYAGSAGQFVQSQLREVGIEAEIDQLEFPARWVDTVLTQGDYDMSIVAHVEARDIVRFANPDYYFHYNSEEFQRLVNEADTGPAEEQADKLKEAARLMSQDAAADWLFLLPNLVITTPNITGVPQNATTLSFDVTTMATR
ncbi:ABC transporter substrate-binding protein [Granulicoccus sp. GXG6511]|uniref:ABC transporter substrate-binding protein n=1 Tax=Granulicoccus sp. GXG6511 TaxID=3381351 RepID=UPI003D7DD452